MLHMTVPFIKNSFPQIRRKGLNLNVISPEDVQFVVLFKSGKVGNNHYKIISLLILDSHQTVSAHECKPKVELQKAIDSVSSVQCSIRAYVSYLVILSRNVLY